ncbi:MAG TPA: hypothetical protein ACFCUY_17180 [Xenococcaceae cyanobacterium]
MIFRKNIKFLNLILLICFIGIITLQNRHKKIQLSQSKNISYLQEESQIQSTINLYKVAPNFGFKNLKADWLFLNFIQYFGDTMARDQTGYSLTSEYFAAIVKNDRQFMQAYITLANANTMYAAQPETTVNLIEDILNSSSLVNSAQLHSALWFHKAYDELFFLGDIKAAQVSYNQGQQWLRQDGSLQLNSPANYLPDIQSLDDFELIQSQILAWSTVLPHVRNSETQQKITQKIAQLQFELAQAR